MDEEPQNDCVVWTVQFMNIGNLLVRFLFVTSHGIFHGCRVKSRHFSHI